MSTNAEGQAYYHVKTINNAPTLLLEVRPNSPQPTHRVVIIPGNPGVVNYYEAFMLKLFHLFNRNAIIKGISHAGHSRISDYDEDAKYSDVHDLEFQIEHKVEFLKDEIKSKKEKLILIGHSIGCYIILEAMKRTPALRSHVHRAFFLFPTIERMRHSPQGRKVTPFLTYLRFLGSWAAYPLSCLSRKIQHWLASRILGNSVTPCAIGATLHLFDSNVLRNILYMAFTEMYSVLDPDLSTIEENLDKLVFFYGHDDHWCPVKYYEDMKKTFPTGDIELCTPEWKHAFVLNSSDAVASAVHHRVTKEASADKTRKE